MATAVSDTEMPLRSTAKAPTDSVSRRKSTTAPFRNKTVAHRNDTRTKKR